MWASLPRASCFHQSSISDSQPYRLFLRSFPRAEGHAAGSLTCELLAECVATPSFRFLTLHASGALYAQRLLLSRAPCLGYHSSTTTAPHIRAITADPAPRAAPPFPHADAQNGREGPLRGAGRCHRWPEAGQPAEREQKPVCKCQCDTVLAGGYG